MPATVLTDPPGIRCMFSDGSTAEFRLEGLPCPQLVSDLLTGLVELIHPHGSLDSANSVDLCLPPIRNLAQGLAAQGFSGGAAELGRGVLIEYRMATRKFRWEAFIRRMLRGFDTTTGRLDPGERELLTGRAYTQAPSRQALSPYSETEWDRLTTHLAMRDRRTWSGQGRATIDPNHSPQVEGDHYLTAATPSQQRAVEALVEDAQHG